MTDKSSRAIKKFSKRKNFVLTSRARLAFLFCSFTHFVSLALDTKKRCIRNETTKREKISFVLKVIRVAKCSSISNWAHYSEEVTCSLLLRRILWCLTEQFIKQNLAPNSQNGLTSTCMINASDACRSIVALFGNENQSVGWLKSVMLAAWIS